MRGSYNRLEDDEPTGEQTKSQPEEERLLKAGINPDELRRRSYRAVIAVSSLTFAAGVLVGLSIGRSALGQPEKSTETTSPVVSGTCVASPLSELRATPFAATFFNMSCFQANVTGNPCDAQTAELYTSEMFRGLRIDYQLSLLLSVLALFSIAQLGGIPHPTPSSRVGTAFWFAWMLTQAAQWLVVLVSLLMHAAAFRAVRSRFSRCLIRAEDGVALLNRFAERRQVRTLRHAATTGPWLHSTRTQALLAPACPLTAAPWHNPSS